MGRTLSSSLCYGIHLGSTDVGVPKSLENHEVSLMEAMENNYIDYATYFSSFLGKDSEVVWYETDYCDDRELYLIIKISLKKSFDGEPLRAEELPHHSDWDAKIKEACQKLNIKYEPPTWLIGCSYW